MLFSFRPACGLLQNLVPEFAENALELKKYISAGRVLIKIVKVHMTTHDESSSYLFVDPLWYRNFCISAKRISTKNLVSSVLKRKLTGIKRIFASCAHKGNVVIDDLGPVEIVFLSVGSSLLSPLQRKPNAGFSVTSSLTLYYFDIFQGPSCLLCEFRFQNLWKHVLTWRIGT